MLGLSGEHLLIAFVVLLIFGPRRLPQIGSTIGKTVRGFRESFKGMSIHEPEFRRLKETDLKSKNTEGKPHDASV